MLAGTPLCHTGHTATLLLAGEAPSKEIFATYQSKLPQLTVAADGGYGLGKCYDLTIDVLIGDMDSYDLSTLEPCQAMPWRTEKQVEQQVQQHSVPNACPKLIPHPPAKDCSDRNLALEYLWQQGHTEILQVGGGGQRSDHFLAMVYDYQHFPQRSWPRLWLTGHEAIHWLRCGERLLLPNLEKQLVSSFPLCPKTQLSSHGLKWALHGMEWLSYASASLSNWIEQPNSFIEVQNGSALVFLPYHCLHG